MSDIAQILSDVAWILLDEEWIRVDGNFLDETLVKPTLPHVSFTACRLAPSSSIDGATLILNHSVHVAEVYRNTVY